MSVNLNVPSNLFEFPEESHQNLLIGDFVEGMNYLIGRTVTILSQTDKRPLIPFYDRYKAIQELTNHKLKVSGGAIWSCYGVYNKYGKQLEGNAGFICFPHSSKVGKKQKEIHVYNQVAVEQVPHLFKYVEYCYKSSKGGKCMAPLVEAQYKWRADEIKNRDLGHVSKVHFKPAVKYEDLSPSLQQSIPYFTKIVRTGLHFANAYPNYEKGAQPDLSEFYSGPNPCYGQIKDNGGIGIDASYNNPSTILTPWGKFQIRGTSWINPEYNQFLQKKFEFATKVAAYEVKDWGWVGPIESITKDVDGNKIPEIEEKESKDCVPYDHVRRDWKLIRDHVFKEACEKEKVNLLRE